MRPYSPQKPRTLGVTVFSDVSLSALSDYLDWTPFFQSWELRGKYPDILNDAAVGGEAQKLYADARALLERVVADGSLRAAAVGGLFAANAVGDDAALYADESRQTEIARLHFLRQQNQKVAGQPNLCLADFIAPAGSGVADYMGAFAVTAGIGADELCRAYEARHDDYSAIMTKALADRLAEAAAEWLHERVRKELWAYAPGETLSNNELIAERYRGVRPAPGYPACPEHTEKRTLFALLNAEANVGVRLTESCAMTPAASVAGWYFAHPEAKYFPVGKIGRDQTEDYARRKGWTLEEAERWLAPNLAYEP